MDSNNEKDATNKNEDDSHKINLDSLNNCIINLDLTKEKSKPEIDIPLEKQKSDNNFKNQQPKDESLNSLSLTEVIEETLKQSKLAEFITLKGDEVVSSTQCIKQLKVEGRVSPDYETDLTQLKIKLAERITQKLGGTFNMDQFWKITQGIAEGEYFKGVDLFDLNGEKFFFQHEKGTVLVIDIWSYYEQISEYIYAKIAFVNKLNGKLDDDIENLNKKPEEIEEKIDMKNVRFLGISGEKDYTGWKRIVNNNKFNDYIPQYNLASVFNKLGITTIPAVIVVDKEGIVRYVGHSNGIVLIESIRNLVKEEVDDQGLFSTKKESKAIVRRILNSLGQVVDENEKDRANQNEWWLEMDPLTKTDIVRGVCLQLKELGANSSQFVVYTQYIHSPKSVMRTQTTPIFTGMITEEEYEILQNVAIDLQNSWNFNGFQFNCKVISYNY
jgi:hypothetical protein